MNASLKPSQIVLMASGAVTFLFSFFAFYKIDGGGFIDDQTYSAWSGDAGTLFMASWAALFGLVVAGIVAAVAFGNVSLPDRVLTFTWAQVFFILSAFSALIMIGYLLGGGAGDGPDKGFGFFLMLLGSLGMVAGSVMELLGVGPQDAVGGGGGTAGGSSGQPPSPF